MTHGLDCQVWVVDFVYEVEDSEGGKGDKNQDNGRQDGSDDFNLLRVENVFVCEFGRDYCDDDVKYQGAD